MPERKRKTLKYEMMASPFDNKATESISSLRLSVPLTTSILHVNDRQMVNNNITLDCVQSKPGLLVIFLEKKGGEM